MTTKANVTVSDLLPPELVGMEEVVKSGFGEKAAAGLPGFAFKAIQSEANVAIHNALDINVFELLARAWCTARELHEYADPKQHPSGERSILTLAKHSLTTTSHPTVDIAIGPHHMQPIRLTLELKANFSAAQIIVSDAHIVGMQSGDCSVSAQLKCGEIPLHNELHSEPLTLPGKRNFKHPGLRII